MTGPGRRSLLQFAAMHDDGYFDERVARRYDQSTDPEFEPETIRRTVDVLEDLAGGPGPALELGVGTGRIALPLSQRGIEVHGIDLSRAMVKRLRAKPGGGAIGVAIGDFATTRIEGLSGRCSLTYLVFNAILNLTTQEAQVACFRNVAWHLRPGGRFAIEVGVPELQRLPPGETVLPFLLGDSRWGFDEYDVARQGLTSHHFEIVRGKVERLSVPFRYVWPSELDLMAELAGMRLVERWDGWGRAPFTSVSRQHVSVWELPG